MTSTRETVEDQATERARERLIRICTALPGTTVDGDQHLMFRVRKRTFAYYLNDHHGDGEVALVCKVDQGLNRLLIEADPARFYMPGYVGHRGWVATRLLIPETDWEEVADLVTDSYCLVAPKKLVQAIDDSRS